MISQTFASIEDFNLFTEGVKAAILKEGFLILSEIATSKIMEKAGSTIPFVHQIYFFKPEYLARMLDVPRDALNSIPLKAIVAREGNRAVVRFTDPEKELEEFASLKELASLLSGKIREIIKNLH